MSLWSSLDVTVGVSLTLHPSLLADGTVRRGACCVRKKSSSLHGAGPLGRFAESLLSPAHSAMRIKVLPGPKDTSGKMAWPPHSPAMSGVPDMFKSKVRTKVKSKRASLWRSGSSNSFPRTQN